MNNFKKLLLVLPVLWPAVISAQNAGYYWIGFTDKNNSPYSVTSPSVFLSQRSIDRRVRQNIPVILQDLPVNQNYIDSIDNPGFVVIGTSKWMNGVIAKVTDSTLLQNLASVSFVNGYKYVKPISYKSKDKTKKQLGTLSDVYNYGLGFDQIKIHNGNVLHNLGYKGDGMLIAVVDAGFTGTDAITVFDSLRNDNRIIATRNFVTGNNNTSVYESSGHGTSVLSTMASLSEGNLVGTAPHAMYALLLSEEAAAEYIFEEYTWVCAAELADSLGADIITSSLGYTTFDDTLMNHTWQELDGRTSVASIAATTASRKGIVVVASAGNSGAQPWHKIGIPADADSILAVGAISTTLQPAPFTSVGPSADGRVKPDVAATGWGVSVSSTSGEITLSNGTSFSCPIIAGLTACLWQAHPNAKNTDIINAIVKSSTIYNNPDTLIGYGIPDFVYASFLLSAYTFNNLSGIKNIYPNPFTDNIYIEFHAADSHNIKIEFCDLAGRVLFSNNVQTVPYLLNRITVGNVSEFRQGVYILNISTPDKSVKKLLIKN